MGPQRHYEEDGLSKYSGQKDQEVFESAVKIISKQVKDNTDL